MCVHRVKFTQILYCLRSGFDFADLNKKLIDVKGLRTGYHRHTFVATVAVFQYKLVVNKVSSLLLTAKGITQNDIYVIERSLGRMCWRI